MNAALVLQGDARALPLPDASADLIVTSPPYFALRSYTDGGEHYDGQIGAEPTPQEYIAALIECTREWVRVLKPSGSIWVNLGDKYNSAASGQNLIGIDDRGVGHSRGANAKRYDGARGRTASGIRPKSLMLLPERYRIACLDELGLIARAVVVWDKPNALPESVTDRVRRSHEDWVHLTKQPRYYSAIDRIRTPPSGYTRPNGAARATAPGVKPRTMADACNPLGALPGSVREVATEPLTVPDHLGVDHFAAFPTEWPRWIIQGWGPTGGVVVDPCGGTGTVALVAAALGCTGISVDRSADYCRLAVWRTTDRAQIAKALRVPKPPIEIDGQLDLLAVTS